jgi:DNA invertase Pin-like site-specific DNA recombinase
VTVDRYAAFLRCSNEELQDPNLSLDRQLRTCQAAVARWGGRIVAVYYEVETGASRYEQRGRGTRLAGFDIPIPRAGGLHELVADATSGPRRFDRVVCESINRLARHSVVAFTLEDEFRAAGVGLHCADEPFEESFGSIVLRHLNVGLARGFLFNLKRDSRRGAETATRQGWHMGGIPPYGYQLTTHEHPNPHKRKRGLVRHTLDLDPVRAPVVRRIYDEYLYRGRGLDQIRDLLNADLDRYPPPVPTDPGRRAAIWNRSSVWHILRNPKYTGYQVWNQRANKTNHGRRNPRDQWIWSDQPAHPAIITRAEWEQVATTAAHNERSRRTPTFEVPDSSKADYVLRNRITCTTCGLRMWGVRRRGYRYYLCHPAISAAASQTGIPARCMSTSRRCWAASPSFWPPGCMAPTGWPTGTTSWPPSRPSPTTPSRPEWLTWKAPRARSRRGCAVRSSTSKPTILAQRRGGGSPSASANSNTSSTPPRRRSLGCGISSAPGNRTRPPYRSCWLACRSTASGYTRRPDRNCGSYLPAWTCGSATTTPATRRRSRSRSVEGKTDDTCQSGLLRRQDTPQCYNPPWPVRLSAKIRLRARYQRECVSRR